MVTVVLLTITRPLPPALLSSRPTRHDPSFVLHPQGIARCPRKSPPTLIPKDDDDDYYENGDDDNDDDEDYEDGDDDDDCTESSQTFSHPDTWDHGRVQLQLSWRQ